MTVLHDKTCRGHDSGIAHMCTEKTRFSQVFSYIIQLRKKKKSRSDETLLQITTSNFHLKLEQYT